MSPLATLHTVSLRAPREAVSLPSSPGPPPPTPPQKKTRASLPSQAEAIGIRARAEPTAEQRKDQWELPGLHLCWHPAQFLSRTEGPEAKVNGLVPTTGVQPRPFHRREVGKHLGSCSLFYSNSLTSAEGVAQPCRAQDCQVSVFLRVAHLAVLHLSLSCCWAFGCHNVEFSPDLSLLGDYLIAGLFPLHTECLGGETQTHGDPL